MADATGPISFTTTTLTGEAFDSSVFQNYDLVMINLWAEWCGPCMGELPDLEQIHQDYPNVLLLGAYCDTNNEAALQAAQQKGVTYRLIWTPYDIYAYIEIENGSFGIPQTCFFDRNGNSLGSAYVGSRNYDDWKAIVDEKLAEVGSEKPVPVPEPGENLPGDVNEDGVVDGRDVVRLMKYLAGEEEDEETGEPLEINYDSADVDGNGAIDEKDLLRLIRYLGGENVKLLPGAISGNG
jgi:thiol-disulfide isomerase/thioredoxin